MPTNVLYYSSKCRKSSNLLSLIRQMYLFEIITLKCVDNTYVPNNIKEIPSLVVENSKPLVGDYITDWLITQGRNLRKNEKPNSKRVNCTEQYMNTLPNCVEDDVVVGYNVDFKQEKIENKVIDRKFANFYNKK